jgi:hypothetical protein
MTHPTRKGEAGQCQGEYTMTDYYCTTCDVPRSEDEVYTWREFHVDPQFIETFTECRACGETVEEVAPCTQQA